MSVGRGIAGSCVKFGLGSALNLVSFPTFTLFFVFPSFLVIVLAVNLDIHISMIVLACLSLVLIKKAKR